MLAVAGNSGSGKTTLIEVVHGLNVDHPGKDSARLFKELGCDMHFWRVKMHSGHPKAGERVPVQILPNAAFAI